MDQTIRTPEQPNTTIRVAPLGKGAGMLRMFQVETNRLPPMLLVIFLSKEKFTITLNVSVTIRVRHRFFWSSATRSRWC